LIFLTYVTYHLISKLRGNEKNAQQNNFGIALAMLGLLSYSMYFINELTFSRIYDKWRKESQKITSHYIFGFSGKKNACYLLFHWFFNLRYVKSTFRLPILKKAPSFSAKCSTVSSSSAKSNTSCSLRKSWKPTPAK